MSEHENKGRDTRSQDQQQGQNSEDVRKIGSSASLETSILARLGLLKEVHIPPGTTAPAWQMRVIGIQKLAEECNETNGEEFVRILEASLKKDAHEAVRMAAVRVLGKIYLSIPGFVTWEPFISALADPHAEVRATTVQVLITFVTPPLSMRLPPQVIETLEKKLPLIGADKLVRMSIIQLLGMPGARASHEAISRILDAMHDADWQIRETAVLALGSLSNSLSSEQCSLLSNALYDENYFVRKAAISATRACWPVNHILEVLYSHNSTEQANAARVLGQWDAPMPEILNALLQVAVDQQTASVARVAALLALAQLASAFGVGVISPGEMEKMKKLADDHDQDEDVRNAAEIFFDALPIAPAPPLPEGEEKEATGTEGRSARPGNIIHFRRKRNNFQQEQEGQDK